MAKKTGKRMPLAEVQLEIDGDVEYEQEHQLLDDIQAETDWIDPREEMRLEEERLQREEAYMYAAMDWEYEDSHYGYDRFDDPFYD